MIQVYSSTNLAEMNTVLGSHGAHLSFSFLFSVIIFTGTMHIDQHHYKYASVAKFQLLSLCHDLVAALASPTGCLPAEAP